MSNPNFNNTTIGSVQIGNNTTSHIQQNVATPQTLTINRNRVLQAFYEEYAFSGDALITRAAAFKRSRLPKSDFDTAHKYLHDKGLVKYRTMGDLDGSSQITTLGIDAFEGNMPANPHLAPQPHSNVASTTDARQVFVVHGRNMKVRSEVCAFLRSLDLRIIEWNDAIQLTGSASPSTFEIVSAGLKSAKAIVILFTGDDEVMLKPEFHSPNDPLFESQLTPQARPNVILEAGMALGLARDRTVIVEVGNIRPMSDIAGLNTVRLTNTAQSRNNFAARLRVAGCVVDTNGADWLSAGEF